MDKYNKRIINKEAVKQCLDEIDVDITDEELKQIFDSIDGNGNGLIEYQEFIRNTCDIKTLMNESNLKNVFHPICDDKDIMNRKILNNLCFMIQ